MDPSCLNVLKLVFIRVGLDIEIIWQFYLYLTTTIIDGHTYGRLNGYTNIQTDPNFIVIKFVTNFFWYCRIEIYLEH